MVVSKWNGREWMRMTDSDDITTSKSHKCGNKYEICVFNWRLDRDANITLIKSIKQMLGAIANNTHMFQPNVRVKYLIFQIL